MKLVVSNLFGTKKVELNSEAEIKAYAEALEKRNREEWDAMQHTFSNTIPNMIISTITILIIVLGIHWIMR